MKKFFWLTAVLLLGGTPATRFGHRAYREAPRAVLSNAGPYRATGRTVQLRREAAEAWRRMVAAAAKDGIGLVPISGFRPVSYQEGLYRRATKRYGSAQAAARWVAPPGHSEHHTGWTLDVGDRDRPDADVEQSFATTPAHTWLAAHAAVWGFELSFPKDNPQGVSYEPWHWRYIGSEEARRLFHPTIP
jgi:LAS superfamily LD-carboxypeptidase LdcB